MPILSTLINLDVLNKMNLSLRIKENLCFLTYQERKILRLFVTIVDYRNKNKNIRREFNWESREHAIGQFHNNYRQSIRGQAIAKAKT